MCGMVLLFVPTRLEAYLLLPDATGTLDAGADGPGGDTNPIVYGTFDPQNAVEYGGQRVEAGFPNDPPLAPIYAYAFANAGFEDDPTFSLAPTVSAEVTLWAPPLGIAQISGGAEATLDYFIRLDGPGTSPVAVDYVTLGETEYSSGGLVDSLAGNSTASITTDMPGFGNQGTLALYGLDNQTFEIKSGTVYLTPGTNYEISLLASVDLVAGPLNASNSGEMASALSAVDPGFKVDPNATDASAYTIEISPNIAAVPEPSSLFLVGAGALSVASVVLRRKSVA